MTNAVKLYEKIQDPMQAALALGEQFHRGKIMGVDSPGDGAVVALTIMAEGITPLEFMRRYHIIQGRPSMRSDRMHAEFRAAGGRIRWLKTGDDGQEAVAEFEWEGVKTEVRYSVDDAKRAGVYKKDSGWEKNPANMLRARVVSNGVRMLAPEIVSGLYDPDEIEHVSVASNGQAGRSAEDVEARRRELDAMNAVASSVAADDDVIDVDPEPAAAGDDSGDDSAPFDGNQKCTNEQLQELVAIGSAVTNAATKAKFTLEEIAAGVRQFAEVDDPSDATAAQIDELIKRFKKWQQDEQ